MKFTLLTFAIIAGALSSAPAMARVCLTESGTRTCATGMPVDGYCMCGNEGGTVMPDGYRWMRQPASGPQYQQQQSR